MPFGLSNAPSTCMRLMNQYLNLIVLNLWLFTLGDIVIYGKDERVYQNHLNQTMMVLEREKLFHNLKKCTFFSNEVTFLGYIVTGHGIKADENKIEVIQIWPIL